MIEVGIVVVEVCDGNAMAAMNLEEILENEYPEVAVLTNDCLSFCGLCRVRPFTIVNNKRIHGKTPEECLNHIREAIEKELAIYE